MGWKLFYVDVFCVLQQIFIFVFFVGCGIQFFFMVFGFVVLFVVGVLNFFFCGGFISVGVGFFVVGGVMVGYYFG